MYSFIFLGTILLNWEFYIILITTSLNDRKALKDKQYVPDSNSTGEWETTIIEENVTIYFYTVKLGTRL
jgi:hypothetical protein